MSRLGQSVRCSRSSHAQRQKAYYTLTHRSPPPAHYLTKRPVPSTLLRAVERGDCSKFGICQMLETGVIYDVSLPSTLSALEEWKSTVGYESTNGGTTTSSRSYISLHSVRSTLYQLFGGNTQAFNDRYALTLKYLSSVSFQLDLLTYSCLLLKPAVTSTLLRLKSVPEVSTLPRFYAAWLMWCKVWLSVSAASRESLCSCGRSRATLKSSCCSFCSTCFWEAQRRTESDRAVCHCGKDLDLYFLAKRER